ncbi:hypothetical protein EBR66_04370 [bacterium]|nr:hypothetical protein [bacterium]
MPRRKLPNVLKAVEALCYAVRSEESIQTRLLVSVTILGIAGYFKVTTSEWVALLFVCGLVLIVEVINTALEELCDKLHPAHDQQIGLVKDLGGAASILAGILAILTLALIFIPKVFG